MRDSLNVPREVSYNGNVGDSNKPAREDHVHGIEVEDWSTPAYSNGWSGTVRYLKDPMGFVHLEGLVTGGNTAGGVTVLTLPPGYRTDMSILVFLCLKSGGGTTYFNVFPDGTLKVGGVTTFGSTTWLGSITFEADRGYYDG